MIIIVYQILIDPDKTFKNYQDLITQELLIFYSTNGIYE